MKKKIIRVGLDFDGVVAYNPFRVVRSFISFFKKDILGIKKLNFWYPKSSWQQFLWVVAHETSIYPAKGIDLLERLIKENCIEAHLVTARYSFLDDHLSKWLDRYKLTHLFKSITLNKNDQQPHIFKEKIIRSRRLDFFVEDNLDIVRHLDKNTGRVKIYWIYNIFDHFVDYKHKFPYLEKALEDIIKK